MAIQILLQNQNLISPLMAIQILLLQNQNLISPFMVIQILLHKIHHNLKNLPFQILNNKNHFKIDNKIGDSKNLLKISLIFLVVDLIKFRSKILLLLLNSVNFKMMARLNQLFLMLDFNINNINFSDNNLQIINKIKKTSFNINLQLKFNSLLKVILFKIMMTLMEK